MKIIAILIFSALFLSACGNPAAPTNVAQQNNPVTNHASNNSPAVPKSETKTKWTQSGNPIDTAEFDAEIAKAEKTFKAKPKDAAAKQALAEAYVKRGVALTGARQYASALGDYRRTLKLDPANEEAKNGMDTIIGIYEELNREYPKEGEEPPPLPFKKK